MPIAIGMAYGIEYFRNNKGCQSLAVSMPFHFIRKPMPIAIGMAAGIKDKCHELSE